MMTNFNQPKEKSSTANKRQKRLRNTTFVTGALLGMTSCQNKDALVENAKSSNCIGVDFEKHLVALPYVDKGDSCVILFSPGKGDKIRYELSGNKIPTENNTITYTGQTTFNYQVGDLLDKGTPNSPDRQKVPEKAEEAYKNIELLKNMKDFNIKTKNGSVEFPLEFYGSDQEDGGFAFTIALYKSGNEYIAEINRQRSKKNDRLLKNPNLEELLKATKDSVMEQVPYCLEDEVLTRVEKKIATAGQVLTSFHHYQH